MGNVNVGWLCGCDGIQFPLAEFPKPKKSTPLFIEVEYRSCKNAQCINPATKIFSGLIIHG